MNGAKNEFLLLDERPPRFSRYDEMARRWCDRKSGAGADGLLVVSPPSAHGVATMHVYNADGSEAEMCGNGLRCVARYLWERGQGDRFSLDTAAGPIPLEIEARDGSVLVRALLGRPRILCRRSDDRTIEALGQTWRYAFLAVPNPHVVIFVEEPDDIDLERLGSEVSSAARFPDGANVHVARVEGAHALRMRHYERGVGLTQACGSGAVAAAVAAIDEGLLTSPVLALVPGGELVVDWYSGGRASLSGPAEVQCESTAEAG